MKIILDTEEIKIYNLPIGAVFEYDGTYYMKVSIIEFDSEDKSEHIVAKSLNLTTSMVENLDPYLVISNNYISKPTEITFK